MHTTIEFPNIGVHLESVGDHITIFGFDIAYYGMIIGVGILAGILLQHGRPDEPGRNRMIILILRSMP